MATTYWCYLCEKPWESKLDPVPPIPTSGRFIALCLPCLQNNYRPLPVKTEDEIDYEYERDYPEEAFGSGLGGEMRHGRKFESLRWGQEDEK
jgi:hypothetical protein